jgi:uncharacterized cupin superfamily protein
MPKIDISSAPERSGTRYPAPFAGPCQGRRSRRLGDAAGLTQFGVNLVEVPPGGWSSQRHWHTHEDEFVWMLEGELAMITDEGEEVMRTGDCAGFKAGDRNGHHFQNRSSLKAVFLVVGSRNEADECGYPEIDLRALPDRGFTHRDGTPY